jgi:hypothetical protein
MPRLCEAVMKPRAASIRPPGLALRAHPRRRYTMRLFASTTKKRAAVRKHSSPLIAYRLNYAGKDANCIPAICCARRTTWQL